VKIAFLFFLLITHLCGAPASWAARHTTVCLDNDILIGHSFILYNENDKFYISIAWLNNISRPDIVTS